jgi:hypothetical protein
MAATNPHKIILKGDPIYKELPLNEGGVCGANITPGMLCERTLTNTVQPHSTAAGYASPLFAIENAIFEGRDIDTDYDEDNEAVLLAFCRPGDEVYALLEAGTGNDTTGAGVLLNSNGAGLLQVGSSNPVARSLEDVDNDPGVAGAPKRIRVEVL